MPVIDPLLPKNHPKYIFISGGVISGLGKGTLTAALSTLFEGCGMTVFPIKADMYLNIDAGTMNPLEHGETFVTNDALECDQDIGTYERFMHQSLNRKNYFTAGQVYQSLLNKERQLKYDGKCVEAFPHIPLEIIDFIHRFPAGTDVVIVEYGGTVGEYQNEAFFEAARMMVAQNPNDICFIHVGYIIHPSSLGELKSKPMQMSIKMLNNLGIFPDVVICRAQTEIDEPRLAKVGQAAGLLPDKVFSCPDVDSVYKLPTILKQQDILKPIFEKLGIPPRRCTITRWDDLTQKLDKLKKKIRIAICGKYYTSGGYSLEDSYISVIEAIKHAAWHLNLKPELIWFDSERIEEGQLKLADLKNVDAVIVPQGWGSRGSEGKIEVIAYARTHKIPYLGLCYGMQMACVEYARHKAILKNAHSEEVDPKTPHPIIHIMDDQKEYLAKKQYGGTIRLGAWPCLLKPKTLAQKYYKKYQKLPKNQIVLERHRHRYEFNNAYRSQLEEAGMVISGVSPDDKLVEVIELNTAQHPFFVATQFHPELISRPFDPHPLFLGLLEVGSKPK